MFKGFQAHTRAFTVKTPKLDFPSVTLPTFLLKQACPRPRRVGCRPRGAVGLARQVWGGRPRLATVAVAAVCLLSGSSGVKGRRRLRRRQIKPTVQKRLVPFHILSRVRVSSEHSDPSSVCSQVESAPHGAQQPAHSGAQSPARGDPDPPGPSWPAEGHAPSRAHTAAAGTLRAPPCQRARTRTRGGPPSRHPLSARPSHPTPLPRCPSSASATGQRRGGNRKPL